MALPVERELDDEAIMGVVNSFRKDLLHMEPLPETLDKTSAIPSEDDVLPYHGEVFTDIDFAPLIEYGTRPASDSVGKGELYANPRFQAIYLTFLAYNLGVPVPRDKRTGKIIVSEAKRSLEKVRNERRRKGSKDMDEYRSAEARAVAGARTILLHGSKPRPCFRTSANIVGSRAEAGYYETFEELVEDLEDTIVLMYMPPTGPRKARRDEQDGGVSKILGDSVESKIVRDPGHEKETVQGSWG